MKKNKKVITYGAFDILHSGHINILHRAYEISEELHVGVIAKDSFDNGKEKLIINSDKDRLDEIKRIIFIKKVFLDFRNKKERIDYIKKNKIDALLIGGDHKNNPLLLEIVKEANIEFIVLERTKNISSTKIRNKYNLVN